jgi:tetratricopeptide (TPR) repeat protein
VRADDAAGLSVRAAPHDGFGRIVFESKSPIGFSAAVEDGSLVVRFDHDASATLGAIAKSLPEYVSGVPIALEGQVLRIPLKRPAAVRTFSEGNAMVVDLVAVAGMPAPTKSEVAQSDAPAPQATPTTPAADKIAAKSSTVLPIRAGEHDDSSRLVFDLDQQRAYTVDTNGNDVHLHIAVSAVLGPLPSELPSRLVSIDSSPAGSSLDISMHLADGDRIKHFRSGTKIVVDIFGPQVTAAARATAPVRNKSVAANVAGKPQPAAAPSTANDQTKPPANPQAATARPTPLFATAQVIPPAPSLEEAPVAADTAQSSNASAVASVGPRVPVSISHDNDVTTIRFAWPKDVDPAAALFVRGGYLWAVFDRSGQLDFGGWRKVDGVPENRRLPAGATAFRYKLPDNDLAPEVTKNGSDWVVSLNSDASRPQTPQIDVQTGGGLPPRLFIKTNDAGSRVMVPDPETGTTLMVIPLRRLGFGIGAERRYADVRLLPTGQGIVVESLSDGVSADVGSTGISIASASGLNLTPASMRAAEAPSKLGQIFNFDAWLALGGDPADARARLQAAILSANAPDRNARRLDLAHYDFAIGSYAETLGVLEAIAADQRDVAEEPELKALRGAAKLEMNDLPGAARDLMTPALDGERDAAPWRGALAAAQKDWPSALRQFVRGDSVLSHYPAALRVQFSLTAAQASLEAGDPSQARVYLETAKNLKPSSWATDRAHWLLGRMYVAFGEYDSADKEWQQAMNGSDPLIRARARFDRANSFLDAGRMSRTDAIAELEKLQFAWRGDAFEYTMLKTLGDLYLQDGKLREGLTVLRKAVANFPGVPGIDAVSAHMKDAFVQFHTSGAAAKTPTLTELAIFQEFRDLVPDGAVGDGIENQLVGRLIELDLLEPAEDLLTDLADHRLKGADESKARNQLGAVLLMDRKAQKAVEMLDHPLAADADADTIAARRQLRARALIDLGKYPEALAMLGDDTSPSAASLRADLFWRNNDWRQASATLSGLTAAFDPAKLSDSDSRLVMRQAIALALANDDKGMAAASARFGKAMAGTTYKDAFAILSDQQRLTPNNLRSIMSQVSDSDRFGAFLDSYRSQLINKNGQPVAAAAPATQAAPASASAVN